MIQLKWRILCSNLNLPIQSQSFTCAMLMNNLKNLLNICTRTTFQNTLKFIFSRSVKTPKLFQLFWELWLIWNVTKVTLSKSSKQSEPAFLWKNWLMNLKEEASFPFLKTGWKKDVHKTFKSQQFITLWLKSKLIPIKTHNNSSWTTNSMMLRLLVNSAKTEILIWLF